MVNQLQPIKTAKKPVRFDLGPKALSTPSEIKLKEPKRGRFASLSVHRKFGSPRTHIIPRARGGPTIPARHKHRSPSRHSDLPIPAPPEVEPTPPTEVVKSTMGNLFTIEEKKYFSKYISWALHLDPMLTKSQLTKKLAEKVRKPIMKPGFGVQPVLFIGAPPYSQLMEFLLGSGSVS
jgi:hypothetical protein